MSSRYTLAIDQGTTNTKVVAVDQDGSIAAVASERVSLWFPQPGWVESDPTAIWKSVVSAIEGCLAQLEDPEPEVVAIGVCNQRESVVMWDRATGRPLRPMVSWQCTRGREVCDGLDDPETRSMVAERTGLGLEPMFSAPKMKWLLDSILDGSARAAQGEICIGTVDSWLVWQLTRGHAFVTDFTNASRTLLFNLEDLSWDAGLLDLFGVPEAALPEVQASSAPHGVCSGAELNPLLHGVVIGAILGDSHAALVGHGAFRPGRIKASFGTGTSVLAPTDEISACDGLSSTVAWSRTDGETVEVCYAIEGNIYATGAALEWTAELLGMGHDVGELEQLAMTCEDSRGVVFVPAFAGLGAPHWDAHARALVTGITFGAGRAELARATFEAVAHQVADVVDRTASALSPERLRIHADGGAARSDLLSRLVADLSDVELLRSDDAETAAVGAAHFAGLTAGIWPTLGDLAQLPRRVTRVTPTMNGSVRREARNRWAEALDRSSSRSRSGADLR